MDKIIEYIKYKYEPLVIIVYGSFADGSNNLESDFDALVISKNYKKVHDTSFVNGIQLDVYVYPERYFEDNYDFEEIKQIYGGNVILDNENKGLNLKKQIENYIENRPLKTKEEIMENISWCLKMLERVKRNDAEGAFRFHWLLVDSLEIFSDMFQKPYSGPKKALKWMKENHPEAYILYKRALIDFDIESLSDWILYMKSLV
ncbi:MAG: nucleotidyltransferase domain-containing protein [Bacillota bacterium]|jgi:predicted nucleotidyltransferase|nr:nucleotidyltransferase domain-containing protein [Bacillota bacterium]NLL26133.1 nucleotidyltransferase domain-containing protein [Erysipelotrichia bacterium]